MKCEGPSLGHGTFGQLWGLDLGILRDGNGVVVPSTFGLARVL